MMVIHFLHLQAFWDFQAHVFSFNVPLARTWFLTGFLQAPFGCEHFAKHENITHRFHAARFSRYLMLFGYDIACSATRLSRCWQALRSVDGWSCRQSVRLPDYDPAESSCLSSPWPGCLYNNAVAMHGFDISNVPKQQTFSLTQFFLPGLIMLRLRSPRLRRGRPYVESSTRRQESLVPRGYWRPFYTEHSIRKCRASSERILGITYTA